MKHKDHAHRGHGHQQTSEPVDHHSGRHHGGRHRHRHSSRPFDYGELRLVVLSMIVEQPRHGYELMKEIGERMGGSYSPSPGVIYPTLSWLDDMGYARVNAELGGRKRYTVTPEGSAFLTANRAAVDDLLTRIVPDGAGGRDSVPVSIVRGMENLKLALRLRLKDRPLDSSAAGVIAAALDTAAQTVERS